MKRVSTISVAISLAALALRLLRLGHQSLWVDEIMTFQQCRPDRDLNFWRQMLVNVQGPLYLSTLWPLVRLSTGEVMLRLPAALAGVATIPALIWCAGHEWVVPCKRLGDVRRGSVPLVGSATLSAKRLTSSTFRTADSTRRHTFGPAWAGKSQQRASARQKL